MKKNMQRLRRGEISRINKRAGAHTDVHLGAPPVNSPAADSTRDPATAKLSAQIADLEAQNAELKKAQADLDSQGNDEHVKLTAELDAVKSEAAKLEEERDELKRQLAEQAEPVKGLRVTKVTEVLLMDDLVRVNCELKPTDGPLGATGAIILPGSEIKKLTGVNEAEEVDETEGNEEEEDDEG